MTFYFLISDNNFPQQFYSCGHSPRQDFGGFDESYPFDYKETVFR